MSPRSPDFPNPFIRALPCFFQKAEQRQFKLPCWVVFLQTLAPADMQQIDDLAIDIKLKLFPGRVACPDGTRVFIAIEPLELELDQPPRAQDVVHDLQFRRMAGHGTQQPIAKFLRLLLITAVEQRIKRERGIADPTKSIIPVADAAELFGKRRGWCGDDAAGRRECKGFERDERSLHRIAPGTVVFAPRRPLLPPRFRVLEGLFHVATWRR